MFINPKSNSGGALLLAIITAFVIAFTTATLTALTFTQVKMTITESNRIQAMNRLKMGMLYAHNQIHTGARVPPFTIDNWNGLNINVINDPDGISAYKIEVTVQY